MFVGGINFYYYLSLLVLIRTYWCIGNGNCCFGLECSGEFHLQPQVAPFLTYTGNSSCLQPSLSDVLV